MKKQSSLPAFVAANFKLQRNDFWQLSLAELAVWAFLMLLMGGIYWFTKDPDLLTLGIPGISVFAMAVITSLICSLSRVWLEFSIGVQMSVPRRRMLVAETALNLATSGLMLLWAALLNGLWRLLFAGRVQEESLDIVEMIPAWGWLVGWLMPVGAGMLCGALVLRFGRRAGWTLYAVFLVLCWSPTLLEDQLEKSAFLAAVWGHILPLLPVLGPAVSVAALAAAVPLLLRMTITN